jgi:hypothetical protein
MCLDLSDMSLATTLNSSVKSSYSSFMPVSYLVHGCRLAILPRPAAMPLPLEISLTI